MLHIKYIILYIFYIYDILHIYIYISIQLEKMTKMTTDFLE